jgi:tetratricopeptide (TPR) repeat protein
LDRLIRLIRRHRAVAATVAIFVAIGLAGIAKYTVDLKRQQRRAEAARGEAENLVAFMLDDLFRSLEPLGRLDLLEEVAREADGYYRRFDDRELGPDERIRRAIALRNLATVLDAQGFLTEGLEGLRRAAAIFTDELASGAASPTCNAELANTRSKIAESLQELGDLEGAVGVLEDALAATRRLGAGQPGDARCRALLVELLNNMAWVLREGGDTESAMAHVDEALTVATAAAAVDPTDAVWRFRLAETESYAARIRQEAGDPDGALADLESARRRLVELAVEEPNNTRWQFELVLTDDRLGRLAEDRGEPGAARRHYRNGLDRGLGLVRHDPANALWEREVSVLHSSLGAVQLAAGDAASARDSFEAGLDISERLVVLSPASTSAVNDLAWDWLQLGTAEQALGRDAEARRAYERAVELMAPVVREVRELWYLDTWAMALLHLGRADEAEDTVAELLAAGWDEPDFLDLVQRNGLGGSDSLQR